MTADANSIRSALGEMVSTDPADLDAVRADASGHVAATRPLAVVRPRTVDEVQAVMRFATRTGTPVVPRGAGTGLAGGAIGSSGEIVLSLLHLDALLQVANDDQYAVVQPGILNAELNRRVEPHGLWFAPDPASRAISTVGGNIATNAGGLLCAKYGVTRDAVLGLKVVLADGRLLELGHRTVKGVTGFDLTALFVGSEGTLGAIVEATVRLRPLPAGPVATVSALFPDVVSAAGASAAITAAGLRPAIMELLGRSALAAITRLLDIPDPGRTSLLVQFDGPGSEEDAATAARIVAAHDGTAEVTDDAAEGERLFEIRRQMHPAMAALGTTLIEDISVPRSALPAMFAAITAVEQKYGISIPTVAHAGDGNLHPNFIFEGDTVPDEIWAAADELFITALELGGTLTGEHGVGTLKRRWLRAELGDDQYALQQEIKRVFDPLGLLNPGKVFGAP